MSFIKDAGYLPNTIPQLMNIVRANVNAQFSTDYDEETFLGTNFYKYFYALIQRLQENEVKTSEIFARMQEYFVITNESIQRPNTTRPGLITYFSDRGYQVSTKAPLDADAGKLYVCANVDSGAAGYAAKKLAICTILKDCVPAGIITQGSEVETITLSNSQSFDFKFNLPTKTAILLKLTITLSVNNKFTILSDADVQAIVYANINARYTLGMDFEPQRYFSVLDAPWASHVLLEYSVDAGMNWLSTVYTAGYRDLLTFALGDISIVEA